MSDKRPAVDVLSAVLREMRLESVGYRWLELGAPWRLGFRQRDLRGVHVVMQGRCELVTAGMPGRVLEPGDLVIMTRADDHVLGSVGGRRVAVTPSTDLAAFTRDRRIRFGGPGELTRIVCGAFFFREADHPALAGLPRVVHVAGERGRPPAWLAPYIDALTTEAADGGAGSDVVMARLSDAMVARALRFHVDHADEPGWLRGLQDPHVARAMAAIHDDLARPWTVAGLARVAGLSRAAFAGRFGATVGEPPVRYLVRCRMRQAMALLREHATLAEAAAGVGYGSEAAFSAAFKRHTGVAPGAYRRDAAPVAGAR